MSAFADAIERGKAGFRYFDEFGPLYYQWTGASASVDLAARRAEQDDIDSAAIAFTSEELADMVASADAQIEEQVRQRDTLARAWTGQAGDDAVATLRRQIELAEDGKRELETVAGVWKEAAAAVDQIVVDKADVLVGFLESDANGQHSLLKILHRSRDEIDRFVTIAQNGVTEDRDLDKLYEVFGDKLYEWDYPVSKTYVPRDVVESNARRLCTEWLDSVLVPDYETKTQILLDTCDSTDVSVNDLFANLADSMTGFDAAFPVPAHSASPVVDGTSPSITPTLNTLDSAPTAPNPSVVPPVVPKESAGTESMTVTPSSLTGLSPIPTPPTVDTGFVSNASAAPSESPLSGLIDLVATATETIGTAALGLIEEALQIGDEALDEPDAAEPVPPGEPVHYDVNGSPVTVTEGPDGELTISTTGPDASSVDITLGADGTLAVASDETMPVEAPVPEPEPVEAEIADSTVPAALPSSRVEPRSEDAFTPSLPQPVRVEAETAAEVVDVASEAVVPAEPETVVAESSTGPSVRLESAGSM